MTGFKALAGLLAVTCMLLAHAHAQSSFDYYVKIQGPKTMSELRCGDTLYYETRITGTHFATAGDNTVNEHECESECMQDDECNAAQYLKESDGVGQCLFYKVTGDTVVTTPIGWRLVIPCPLYCDSDDECFASQYSGTCGSDGRCS